MKKLMMNNILIKNMFFVSVTIVVTVIAAIIAGYGFLTILDLLIEMSL